MDPKLASLDETFSTIPDDVGLLDRVRRRVVMADTLTGLSDPCSIVRPFPVPSGLFLTRHQFSLRPLYCLRLSKPTISHLYFHS